MMMLGRAALVLIVAMLPVACATGSKRPQAPTAPPSPDASMWVEPADLATRDLFNGPWGAALAPDPAHTYTLIEKKHTGTNPGMTVRDERGREWSVKQAYPGGLDAEGPVEVVLSRILSAIGYYQAHVYYLPAFRLKDAWGSHIEIGGRFRLKDERLVDRGTWNWEDSPFAGTKPYQGLLVLLMMFNSTDTKYSNNTLYEHRGERTEQWYAVRDIGAALGDTRKFSPRKNNIDAFERTPFILGVRDGFVDFAYHGLHKNLVRDRITPDDVAWASELLGRLSLKQWSDAFRAAGYEPATADRFIARIQQKIDQGRALAAPSGR